MKRNLSLLLSLCLFISILSSVSVASALTPTTLEGSSLKIRVFTDAALTTEVTNSSTVFAAGTTVYVVPYVTVPANAVNAFDISVAYDSAHFTYANENAAAVSSGVLLGDPVADFSRDDGSTTRIILGWGTDVSSTSFGIACVSYTVGTTASAATFKFKAVSTGEMSPSTGDAAYSFASATNFDLTTITYNSNNGTGTMADQTGLSGATVTLRSNAFTRTGYAFAGWNTVADGSGTAYTNGQTITMPEGGLTLYAQWNNEITGFAAIADVSGGTTSAPTYANAAAVIAVLPTSVTANVTGGTVTVPVTTWVDTDIYSTATAGSYTFTATLGFLPSGYANTGKYTATVEVTITSGDPTFSIAGSSTSPNLRFDTYTTSGGTTYNLIRGLNPLGENIKTIMTYFSVTNGSWKLYKLTATTGAYTEVYDTDTSNIVGSGFKIEILKINGTVFADYYVLIKGDVTSNGKIENSDIILARNYLNGKQNISSDLVLLTMDTNYSTSLNISNADIILIRSYLNGKAAITQ